MIIMQHFITQSIFLSLSLLFLSTTLSAQNMWGRGISGEGPVVEKEISLDKFHGFDMAISGNVIVEQGSSQKVRVKGQENIIDNLKTEVRDGIWKIGFKTSTNNYKDFIIYITVPELSVAELSGSGNIESKGVIKSDNLKTELSGSGNINLNLNTGDLQVKLSGSGNIMLAGKTQQSEMKISGSGNIKTYDLEAQDCEIRISGSGHAKVNAVQSLNAHVSGSGGIYYKGKPEKLRSKVTGSGDVVSRN